MAYQPFSGSVIIAPFSSRPSPSISGRVFIASDGGGEWIDNGSSWLPKLNTGVLGVQPPSAASFTTINSTAGLTLADSNGGLLMTGVDDGSSPPIRGFIVAADGTSTDYVEATLAPLWQPKSFTGNNFPKVGVFVRENSSGKMISITMLMQTTSAVPLFEFTRWTDFTTRDNTANYPIFPDGNAPFVLRIIRTTGGAQYEAQYSRDRVNWEKIDGNSGTFNSQPDQLGLCVTGQNNIPIARIQHFKTGH